MMKPEDFQAWVTRDNERVEIIAGLSRAVAGRLEDAEVRPGDPVRAGGYGEDRSLYTQKLFAPEGEEARTVHIGLDIFAPQGAEVLAPVSGHVHSCQDNAKPGDYGPTIILEHSIGGKTFHTLYGHLSRDSIKGLKPRSAFMAGERIGALGTRRENGGWPPHLHFQILLDIGHARGDYPGVCKRSERDAWLAICPDPRPLLGMRSDR